MPPEAILPFSPADAGTALTVQTGAKRAAVPAELLAALPAEHIETASRLGLSVKPGLSLENWSRLVANIVHIAGQTSHKRVTLTAWLGDLLAFGSEKYRGQITEYAKAADLDPGTLRVAKLVCSRIPLLCRHNALSWSHHCEIAQAVKDPAEIKCWLETAARERLNIQGLRQRLRQRRDGPPKPDGDPTPGGAAVPFAFMRELRAVGRLVKNHPEVWREWSPQTCQEALSEMKPIVDFLDELNARAARVGRLAKAG